MVAASVCLHAKPAAIIINGKSWCAIIDKWWLITRKLWLYVSVFCVCAHLLFCASFYWCKIMYINYTIFRMCVIRTLPKLEYLDDVKIMDGQRAMARTNISARTFNAIPINLRGDFSSTPNLLTTTRKYDVRIRRYHTTKYGNIGPKLMTKPSTSKFDRIWNHLWINKVIINAVTLLFRTLWNYSLLS